MSAPHARRRGLRGHGSAPTGRQNQQSRPATDRWRINDTATTRVTQIKFSQLKVIEEAVTGDEATVEFSYHAQMTGQKGWSGGRVSGREEKVHSAVV